MGGMTERVALHYTGDQPVRLPESAGANPTTVHPDTTVVVNGWAAKALASGTRGQWTEVKGEQLHADLEAAGLPTTGTADEKRDRLAQHEAALAAALLNNDRNDDQETDRG